MRFSVLVLAALFITAACSAPEPDAQTPAAVDNAAEVARIEQLYAHYRDAVEAGSIQGYLDVLHPDVRLLPPGADPIVGAKNYAEFLKPVFETASYRIEVISYPEVEVVGDFATAEYEYVVHLDLKNPDVGINEPGALTAQSTRSRYFDVLRRDDNGRWAIWRHSWNVVNESDVAAAGGNTVPADDKPPVDGISFSYIKSNGITMRIAEAGEGPLVLFAHGFPESWYSWRHQLKALAKAGYRAVAPDMRGYGLTDAPPEAEAYTLDTLAADMVGILDALGVEQAHMVGHDWGSPVAAHAVVRYPDRFQSLTLMSVPYGPRSPVAPMAAMRERVGDNFFYMLYHNEPGGIAEAEYDADPRAFLFAIYQSPDSPRNPPAVTDPKRSAGGWLPRLGKPLNLPGWLRAEDLDYYVSQFERTGFRGGVNYYRNLDRNWEASADIADPVIRVPMLFIAGQRDMVIAGASAEQLAARMAPVVSDLRNIVLLPGIGHWVQQEAAAQVNATMLQFFNGLQEM